MDLLYISRSCVILPTLHTLAPSSPPHPSRNIYLAILCFFVFPLFLLVLISPVLGVFSCVRNNLNRHLVKKILAIYTKLLRFLEQTCSIFFYPFCMNLLSDWLFSAPGNVQCQDVKNQPCLGKDFLHVFSLQKLNLVIL